jgi:hypothetical protein
LLGVASRKNSMLHRHCGKNLISDKFTHNPTYRPKTLMWHLAEIDDSENLDVGLLGYYM